MFHIYIYTPLYNLWNYIPHIIEHCAYNIKSEKDFFKYGNEEFWNSTYYSYFILETNDKSILAEFIENLSNTPLKELIQYEHCIIKKENKHPEYSQKLINKIWKELYWKKFNFNQTWKVLYSKVLNYHKKYYKKNNMIILENNIKYYTWKLDTKLKLHKNIKINIEKETELIYIFKHSIETLFTIYLISDLIDNFLYYNSRFKNKEYFRTDSIYWDFEDYIYISIDINNIKLSENINKSFISEYINNNLNKKDYLSNKDFDGSCMVKYWYTLSNEHKKELLLNLEKYYAKLISMF